MPPFQTPPPRPSAPHYKILDPPLPPGEIVQAVGNIRPEITDDGQHVEGLKKLVTYINKQLINKRSVGPERERLSVRDNRIVSH